VRISFRVWILAAIALLVAAACDSNEGAAEASDDGPTLSITSPSEGDELSLPFKVEISSSEEIGPEETGLHHWHLFVDGNELEYTVEPSSEAMIDDLSPGEHTINATLQHADHSSAGASDAITVMVGEEGTVDVTEGGAGEEDPPEGGSESEPGSGPGIDY
jgi:hypothetical protein